MTYTYTYDTDTIDHTYTGHAFHDAAICNDRTSPQ